MINKNFRLLFSAFLISSVGDWLFRLALPLLIYKMTGSALDMAIAYAMTFLPFVLVTPFGGVIADRWERRKILIYADFCAFVCTLLLGILAFFTHNLYIFCFLIFLISAFTSLAHPAFQSIIPQLVPKGELAKANSLMSVVDNLLLLIGPLAGGLTIAILGSLNAIFLNAASFILSSTLVFFIKILNDIYDESEGKYITFKTIFKDLTEGFNYVWNHNPTIKYGCLLFVFANFGLQLFYANFIFFLANFFHLNPNQIGLTLALSGVGAVTGALIAPMVGKYYNAGRLIVICCLLEGLMVLTLLGAANEYYIALSWGIASAFGSITIVTYFTLRQQVVPSNYLGRSIAITRLISYSAIPVASILGGWILQITSHINYLILISGVIMIINACVGWFSPLGRPSVKNVDINKVESY